MKFVESLGDRFKCCLLRSIIDAVETINIETKQHREEEEEKKTINKFQFPLHFMRFFSSIDDDDEIPVITQTSPFFSIFHPNVQCLIPIKT